jgi:hypothetical protein
VEWVKIDDVVLIDDRIVGGLWFTTLILWANGRLVRKSCVEQGVQIRNSTFASNAQLVIWENQGTYVMHGADDTKVFVTQGAGDGSSEASPANLAVSIPAADGAAMLISFMPRNQATRIEAIVSAGVPGGTYNAWLPNTVYNVSVTNTVYVRTTSPNGSMFYYLLTVTLVA